MKYAISLFVGMLAGVALFLLGVYHNPFVGKATVSPLAVTNDRVIDLGFSAVPSNGLLFTNHGEATITPFPERVAELWEPAIYDTSVYVTILEDSRGKDAGIGIKYLSKSEATRLLKGEALANSAWHIYLPGRGTLLIDQTENYWSYLRDIVIPAHWSSGDNWRGSYYRVMTNGPGALGTARVTGGSGLFAGLTTESVESLSAEGYSARSGPVSMRGSLTVALPNRQAVAQE
jgi:hypothetical protein